MVIAITLALGKGFWQVFVAVGITMWVEVARLVRGLVKSTKEDLCKSRSSIRIFKESPNLSHTSNNYRSTNHYISR